MLLYVFPPEPVASVSIIIITSISGAKKRESLPTGTWRNYSRAPSERTIAR